MSEAQHLPIWTYVVDCSLHCLEDCRFAHRKFFRSQLTWKESEGSDVLRLDTSLEIDKRCAKTEREEDMPTSMTTWFIIELLSFTSFALL